MKDMKDTLDRISPDDALQILQQLYKIYPDFQSKILSEAEKILCKIDKDEIAEEVFIALDSIDVHELWDRAGPSQNGYSSPDEMAFEMLEEELEPYNEKVKKYQELDIPEQAKLYCMGVLKGIYKYEHKSKSEFKDWAIDIPPECFGFLLDKWEKNCTRNEDLKEMNEFIKRECPNWAKSGTLVLKTT